MLLSRTQEKLHPLKRAAGNTVWSMLVKLFTMIIKFFTVPIVLKHYGKVDYGLIILAISLSGYMSIVNLGLPTGMIKHTAAWLGTGQLNKLIKATRSSITFYCGVGLLNFLIFLFFAHYGLHIFNIPSDKSHEFQQIFIIAAFGTLFTWPFLVLNQLLSGAEELAWLSKIDIFQEIVCILVIFIAVWMDISITWYFLLYVIASTFTIPFKLLKWNSYVPVLQSIRPGWYWEEFKELLYFGLGLLVIGLAFSSSMQLRPIILAARASDGIAAVAEYQILLGIVGIVQIFQGIISSSLLPVASKTIARGDRKLLESIIYKVTKYVWTALALIIFAVMMVSDRMLTVYVGHQYANLAPWLAIWLSAFFFLYLTPITSVVMGTGNVNLLIFTSPIAALVSLSLAWALAPKFNIGAVAISTVAHYGIQFLVYHIYYLPRVLNISPIRMLTRYFLPPVVAGTIMVIVGRTMATALIAENPYLWILIALISGVSFYILYIFMFSIKPSELFDSYKKLRAKEVGIGI